MIIKLTLPYPPSVNKLYATRNGIRILSERGREYKKEVFYLCRQMKTKCLVGDVMVSYNAYRPRLIGDLDNIQKILFDSLKGNAYIDDKQIVQIHAYRFDDKENPRVEVEIQEV